MADTKISGLPAVTSSLGADEIPVNEAGTTKKLTITQLFTPTIPTVISVGTEFHSTAVPTATLPGTHTTNDILLLILQSSNESNIAAPAGYAQLGPQNAIGKGVTAGTTKLSIFWKRDGGAESAPTIPDTGDHTYGCMIAIRGCPTVGDPFHLLGQNYKFTTSTTGTSPRGTTVVANCLILDIFGHAIDLAGAQSSGQTNADLATLTEQYDGSTTDGTGGGIVVISGTKVNPGGNPIAATTTTWASTSADVSTRVAFLPSDISSKAVSPPPSEVQTFLGTAQDLDDTWVKPFGARMVLAQICDGGGSGSGGNITTTAEGGGGGGGGGYDEAWFRADDLAATIIVHAGMGGVAGTALNQAGTVGVVSEFDKGTSTSPLTSVKRVRGNAAGVSASAVGGTGGGGGGRGTAVKTSGARIDLNAATAGVAAGGSQGRGGGPGGTTPVGGSPGEYGGGGGESGADTDAGITSILNGYSVFGASGGSGGRTDTTISIPGFGGGAVAPTTPQGAKGNDSTRLPFGGTGGINGGSTTVTGGTGGFPGGGGGGGAGVAGGFGGQGGHGCVVITTFF